MTNPMTTKELAALPNNEPAVIYMQWYGIEDAPLEPLTPSMIDEATWCIQQIDSTDVKYYHEQTILALTARVEAWEREMDLVRRRFLKLSSDWRNHSEEHALGASEVFQMCADELNDAICEARAALNAKDVT